MKIVDIDKAVQILKTGNLVVIPTETVYGLAADGLNEDAVAKIFSEKGRPQSNPLILHVSSLEMLEKLVEEINVDQRKLINKFWPGPLTLLFKKKLIVPKNVTAGRETVCVRMPKHDKTLEIIKKLGRPLAAPSANRSGRPSPTTFKDANFEMPNIAIVDGGALELGIESTIVDLTDDKFTLLRAGSLDVVEIEKFLNRKISFDKNPSALAPGMQFKHYSPEGDLILVWPWESFGEKVSKENGSIYSTVEEAVADSYLNYKTGIVCSADREKLYFGYETLSIGADFSEQAKYLYSTLFETEKLGWQKIIVDMTGISNPLLIDRLKKAASKI
ncbi:threonylcarbamoyl-AMP synthase [Candidatus Peregrinibacteria bacterium]|nr:threonylcarbamoyl-AMP synthase [Candidatus Peregrinibacteria bacterium]